MEVTILNLMSCATVHCFGEVVLWWRGVRSGKLLSSSLHVGASCVCGRGDDS